MNEAVVVHDSRTRSSIESQRSVAQSFHSAIADLQYGTTDATKKAATPGSRSTLASSARQEESKRKRRHDSGFVDIKSEDSTASSTVSPSSSSSPSRHSSTTASSTSHQRIRTTATTTTITPLSISTSTSQQRPRTSTRRSPPKTHLNIHSTSSQPFMASLHARHHSSPLPVQQYNLFRVQGVGAGAGSAAVSIREAELSRSSTKQSLPSAMPMHARQRISNSDVRPQSSSISLAVPAQAPQPPQTCRYWTSDRTRRREYAALDAEAEASRKSKCGFSRFLPRWCVPGNKDTETGRKGYNCPRRKDQPSTIADSSGEKDRSHEGSSSCGLFFRQRTTVVDGRGRETKPSKRKQKRDESQGSVRRYRLELDSDDEEDEDNNAVAGETATKVNTEGSSSQMDEKSGSAAAGDSRQTEHRTWWKPRSRS